MDSVKHCCCANPVVPTNIPSACSKEAASLGSRIWKKIDGLRHEDALVIGAQITGFLGVATIGSWVAYGMSRAPLTCPLSASLLTLGLATFYGNKDGPVSVFTDYFPKSLELTRSQMKPKPDISHTGVWMGTGKDVAWSQFTDPRLAAEIADFLTEEGITSAWDFGCGRDEYSKVLMENDILCNGLDGNPDTVALSGETALVQDLAVPFQREKRDCVISLEVGAKIPKKYEDQFLKNIVAHANDLIILSWPVKGQKGPHQLNTQNNDYIIGKLDQLGWKLDSKATHRLRDHSHPIYYWFHNTTMVFRKKEAV